MRNRRVRAALFHLYRARALLAGAALLGGALLPSPQLAAVHAQTASVHIVNFAFDPDPISVPVGATVTWVNEDSAPHTSTAVHKEWSSPVLDQGQSFSHTFGSAGTFSYYCVIHANMVGTVVVGGAGGATATPQPSATSVVTAAPPPPSITATPIPTSTLVPTSVPTPTSTSISLPAGAQLYTRCTQALRSTRGYHLVERATQTLAGGKKQTLSLTGDVASRGSAERLTLLRPDRGKTARTDIIQTGTRAWMKRVPADRSWKAIPAARVDRLLSPLRNPLEGQTGLSVSKQVTVGATTYSGTSVWHVRWTEKSGSLSGTVDALIAKQGFLPYTITRTLTNSASGAHLQDRITRSRFGEKLQITSPKS